MITLYGIPNCDTIKKARKWLQAHDVEYQFHNYKADGVPGKKLESWVKQVGWEMLLNRRGTTWRKLDDAAKENVTEKSAIQLMLDNPSIIKRPILEIDNKITVGFSDSDYKQISWP
jgi:arsenate reductase